MTRPRSSPHAVSITRSALSPATNPGPSPIASGARPRSASGVPCLCIRASTRTSGSTAASTSSKGESDTGSALPQASIFGRLAALDARFANAPASVQLSSKNASAKAMPRRGWDGRGIVVQDDGVAERAQPKGDRRADVACAANEEAGHRRLAGRSGACRPPGFHRARSGW